MDPRFEEEAMSISVRSERPKMEGYGVSESPEGLLPWSWAEERMARTRNFWVSTTRKDGRPHAMAVWAVWVDGGFYFSTGSGTVKARNLARCPECVVTTESADEPVVIEGAARVVASDIHEVVAAYEEKYAMAYPPDSVVYRVEPRVAFGFYEDAARFADSATRWIFE